MEGKIMGFFDKLKNILKKDKEVFEDNSEKELYARTEILSEQYIKTIEIETKTKTEYKSERKNKKKKQCK